MILPHSAFSILTVHTERLHDDRVWRRVSAFADYLHARGFTAVWFSINPAAPAYVALGYDVQKWITRLAYLRSRGQRIEQHSHFYGVKKGSYDLSSEYMVRRLQEDRTWLESHGHTVKGFVSGAWIMNGTLMDILGQQGYDYDCSAHTFRIPYLTGRGDEIILTEIRQFGSVREIPTTHALKNFWRSVNGSYQLVYLHDYDLLRLSFRLLIRLFLVGRTRLESPLALL